MTVKGFASRACAMSVDRGRCIYVVSRRGRIHFRLAEARGDRVIGRAIGEAWFPGIG